MSRVNILLFSLAFLACFCSQSMALPSFGGALRNTVMNAHATSSGIINLQKDAYGQFYVETDFSYSYSAKNASVSTSLNSTNMTILTDSTNSTNGTNGVGSNPSYGRMMISTVNTDSMVATSCFNFYYYDCSTSTSCSKYSNTKSIVYPTFTASAYYAYSPIYLDYNYWSVGSSNYLYIAYSCSGNSNLGSGQYGVLGLGTGTGGSSNFGYSPIFSIFIDSSLTSGKLLFKSDTSTYAQNSNNVQSFYASNTWQISASSAYLQVGSYSVSMSGNVMFDINSNAIGLPQSYYNTFLTYFGYQSGVYCYSGYNSRPYCYTTYQIKNLPDITLSIGGAQITIPSAIYASAAGSSGSYNYFYLNFKATSPSLSGVNYVSSAFANSIILDANFMSYYYTVFDATNGYNYIYLYLASNGTPSPAKWIGGGGFVALLLISICCCCAKKNRGVNTVVVTAPLNTTAFNNTTQVVYTQPAIVTTTTVPTYSYDANQYNYPGYNAQQQPQGGVYQPYPGQGYVPPTNYQGTTQ